MTCKQVAELLAAYADGGLEGREHDTVAAHVRGCAACAGEVRLVRELLDDTKRLGAGVPERGERFWQALARDIDVAVAASKPRIPWWRMPALFGALAMAAAAVIWVQVTRNPPAVAKIESDPEFDVADWANDVDAARTMLANLDVETERQAGPPTDDELAIASPAAAETLVENLDEDELARVHAAL
jgi:hypothetical protein